MFKCRGFTLIEVLVSLFIIVLISGIIFANYRTGKRELALQRAANKLAQDIRRTQQMAMSAKDIDGVPNGYGVYINQNEPDKYRIYADSSSPPNQRRNPNGSEDLETIFFESGITIKSVSPAQTSINFEPPNPTTTIKDNAGNDSNNVEIILQITTNSSKTKTIKVNKAGLIQVE